MNAVVAERARRRAAGLHRVGRVTRWTVFGRDRGFLSGSPLLDVRAHRW